MWKKNFLTILLSIFFSFFFLYALFFFKNYLQDFEKHPYIFKSLNDLKFHKNYTQKLHHIRDTGAATKNRKNTENYLFNSVNEYSSDKKNILMQGDSWVDQINFNDKSYNLINNFVKENNFGFINAGNSSYSPSLMQIQYEILEKDFSIKPNILITYIDQTDIGDELCRYKDKRIYDENKNLIAVKSEYYTSGAFENIKIYAISEAVLLSNSKVEQTFKLTNFFIKYGFLRGLQKIKYIQKFGWKNHRVAKCKFSEITKYLVSSKDAEISYFKDRVKDYINFLSRKEYLEKIVFVTFPHRAHLFGYKDSNDKTKYYFINVSNVIEEIVKDEEKIYHLNFSELISDKKINLEYSDFTEYDLGAHILDEPHANIFIDKILNLLR